MVNLVADVGGTNVRFALCEPDSITLQEPRKYPNVQFDSLEDAITYYLADVKQSPKNVCLAVAGPMHAEVIKLTNIDWQFRADELKATFGFDLLVITNDFTALAMSVPHLEEDGYVKTGGGSPVEHRPIAVLGPGTGLGVSGLVWSGSGWIPIEGEGGNAAFAPVNELEIALLSRAIKDKPFVRSEDFISGNGLSYLHSLLQEIDGRPDEQLAAKDITWRAKTSDCDRCKCTIDVFCGMLGSFAGNIALSFGALGGVYIGGGIVPQFEELFVRSPFRASFEAKGPFTQYVSSIPTYALHSHSRNALIGATAILQLHLQKELHHA